MVAVLIANRNRPVTSHYESDQVVKILPMMTQPFDFKENKCALSLFRLLYIRREE